MPSWRVWLVQLLNIAGLGPVFGPIMGAVWGPQVFLWIVFGCILGGAVHDMLSGFMSIRNGGAGLPDLIGRYLGEVSRHLATGFILVLMILVGTVFVKGPALLIVQLLPVEMVGGWLGPGGVEWLSSSVAGHPLDGGMVEHAGADTGVVAGECPGDVLHRLPDVRPHLGRLYVDGVATQLEDGHLHRVAGPGGRLLEYERHAPSLQHPGWRRIHRQVQDPDHFIGSEVVHLE
jgi:hypothetical protein